MTPAHKPPFAIHIVRRIELFFLFIRLMSSIAGHRKFLLSIFPKETRNGLDKDELQRILLYGSAVPAMIGQTYAVLRGFGMSKNEKLSLTCLGAITGLFDDLSDKYFLPEKYIRNLILQPKAVTSLPANEKVFLQFYKTALENSDHPEIVKSALIRVHKAQMLSRSQKNPESDPLFIDEITREKGGASMLFYRSVLKMKPDETETELIYLLGATGQLENDIFDIYKDHLEGINTLATRMNKTNELREIYIGLMNRVFVALDKTSFESNNKRKFRRQISLIMARTLVCLDCLEKNESKTDGRFALDKYERRNLICDMEKPRNLLKMLNYSAQIA